ncbi:MAG: hypothetical protein HYV28_16035 [Ignavibacteriales bacterium]|nr:hypothetical protein [Ignavibacteriales bacterium]
MRVYNFPRIIYGVTRPEGRVWLIESPLKRGSNSIITDSFTGTRIPDIA